ncbi:hypothetical protein PoB_005845000 [Plakobranchus ocellatus]|uniref:THAP-type domain-containing protein n=1 Tax=Plakobranchus ocellatus TaxID=259542 RepID=A0AAV4CGH8_9GAST|nr:hypothetical protein PoB_005845000 [Plakobranchus ocellatus]
MVHCAWIGCPNNSSLSKERFGKKAFFRFPSDPALRKIWEKNTMRDFTGLDVKTQRLCQDHFDSEMFKPSTNPDFLARIGFTPRDRAPIYLREGAVPRKFDPTVWRRQFRHPKLPIVKLPLHCKGESTSSTRSSARNEAPRLRPMKRLQKEVLYFFLCHPC